MLSVPRFVAPDQAVGEALFLQHGDGHPTPKTPLELRPCRLPPSPAVAARHRRRLCRAGIPALPRSRKHSPSSIPNPLDILQSRTCWAAQGWE